MNLIHPLQFVPPARRKPVFRFSLSMAAACFVIFQTLLDPPLRTGLSTGIVSFEFAGTAQVAADMVAGWTWHARLMAAFGLGFDFLFMPLYATALSSGLLLITEHLQAGWRRPAYLLGWGAYLAIPFDAIENIALFSILNGNLGANPQIAFGCAAIKFGLLGLGLGYALLAGLFALKKH